MPNKIQHIALANEVVRSLIGTYPTEETFHETLKYSKPRFSVNVPEEYNENYRAMVADFAKLINKYFE